MQHFHKKRQTFWKEEKNLQCFEMKKKKKDIFIKMYKCIYLQLTIFGKPFAHSIDLNCLMLTVLA